MPSSTSHPWAGLDYLYQGVLAQSVTAKVPLIHIKQFTDALAAIAPVPNPLSVPALCELLGLSPPGKMVVDRLRKLHSVLSVSVPATIRILHSSFRDFLTDRNRCTNDTFYINPQLHHGHLAQRCLLCMCNCLRRDICRLGCGPCMNTDVADLYGPLVKFILEHLQYACRFWAAHLSRASPNDTELYDETEKFLSGHFFTG